MKVKITVRDSVLPMLDYMIEKTPLFAREALSKGGAKLQKRIRSEMAREQTQWHQDVVGGKRRIYKLNPHQIGITMSHETGRTHPLKNMSRLINSYISPNNPYFVAVGGAHPTFYPLKIRDGKVVGSMGRVKGVSKTGAAILHKLNTGEVTPEHPYYNRSWIPNANYPHRGFYERAWGSVRGQVEDTIIKSFTRSVLRTMNQMQFEERKVKA